MTEILTPEERLAIAIKVFGSNDGIRPKFPQRGEAIQEYSLELSKAQQAKDEQKIEKIFKEIEKASHPMNTNMYGISLGKDTWENIKSKYKEEK